MNQWLETLITFIYPAKCRCCQVPMGMGQVPYICDECWGKIECLTPPWCQLCGIPVHFKEPHSTCVHCQAQQPLYGKLRSIAFYQPTIREAIHLFKYDKKPVLAKHLTQFMFKHLPDDLSPEDYDFLLPIPLHKKRHQRRGFNQAEQIAEGLAKVWKVPVRTDILHRIKDTVPQSRLDSRQQRVENIAGAFEVRLPKSVRNQKILLVDDIFTTGTTVNEAISVLRTVEVANVDVLTFARARPSV